MTISRNSWLFLVLGLLIGAAGMAAYAFGRWNIENVRIETARANTHLDLLERWQHRDDSARLFARGEAQAALATLAAFDDLSFFQCVNRRKVLERASLIPELTRGNDSASVAAAQLLSRHRAGAFVCERGNGP
ncbi:MAG: hypothetical protein ABIP49_03635 [Lysobacterales bacterium]